MLSQDVHFCLCILTKHGRPAFLEGGARIGQGGRHLTAVNKLFAFGQLNQRGGGGECCSLSADSISEVLGVCSFGQSSHSISGGRVLSTFNAHVCKLLLQGGGGEGGLVPKFWT